MKLTKDKNVSYNNELFNHRQGTLMSKDGINVS
jgi:hypothetical protein